jgi:hypothetical protein
MTADWRTTALAPDSAMVSTAVCEQAQWTWLQDNTDAPAPLRLAVMSSDCSDPAHGYFVH